jgi:hypothetical protein
MQVTEKVVQETLVEILLTNNEANLLKQLLKLANNTEMDISLEHFAFNLYSNL